MGDSSYSFSLTTFSPTGKLLQIEYALAAVEAGGTALGVKGECLGANDVHASRGAVTAHARARRRRRPAANPPDAATNGVVLVTEKKVPSVLVDESSLRKIEPLAEHVGATAAAPSSSSAPRTPPLSLVRSRRGRCIAGVIYAGMGPDARVLVRKAQKKAAAYKRVYGVRALAHRAHRAAGRSPPRCRPTRVDARGP